MSSKGKTSPLPLPCVQSQFSFLNREKTMELTKRDAVTMATLVPKQVKALLIYDEVTMAVLALK